MEDQKATNVTAATQRDQRPIIIQLRESVYQYVHQERMGMNLTIESANFVTAVALHALVIQPSARAALLHFTSVAQTVLMNF